MYPSPTNPTLMRYIVLLLPILIGWPETKEYKTWKTYNGSAEGIKYSTLTQIDTTNVAQLQVAWTYHTGDADTLNGSQIQCNPIVVEGVQCNPIVVEGVLYGVGPQMKLFAIDAATGKEMWVFDANAPTDFDHHRLSYHIMINSRGVAYWTDGQQDKRIFFTAGSLTYAVDANTGKPIPTFGNKGAIDLHNDLGRDAKDLFVVSTSPGVVYKNLLIMGTRVKFAHYGHPRKRSATQRTGTHSGV